ncbi:hypothetical protein RZS08_07285, partial [Arthrospira platensis SPKY1]|nr:hypothetical protein [Arthrospira platensis SPKY1]
MNLQVQRRLAIGLGRIGKHHPLEGALVTEFHRVVGQLVEDAEQFSGGALPLSGRAGLEVHRPTQPFGRRTLLPGMRPLLEQRGQFEYRQIRAFGAGVLSNVVQDVIDQAQQLAARLADVLGVLLLDRGQRGLQHQVGHAQNGIQWRA